MMTFKRRSGEAARSPGLAVFLAGAASILLALPALAGSWQQSAPAAGSGPNARPVGVIKSVQGNSVVLTTDSGSEIEVMLQDSTRLLRTAPGQKDLSGATMISAKDLAAGDRMLVRGTSSADGKSVLASSAIVIRQSDLAEKQARDREDWTKRGVGGLVQSVTLQPSANVAATITISLNSLAGSKSLAIEISKATIVRRYAPDSVQFDEAKPGTLDQIKAGDQLRARGQRNPEGTELQAEEIVSGAFRNIAGTVDSTDAASRQVSVMDLLKKKLVTVKLGGDSQLRKLPPFMAQRLAARLGSGGARAGTGAPAGPAAQSQPAAGNASSDNRLPPGRAGGADSQGGGGPRSGPPDFQQMLSRMPAVSLADLHKGDAVMIVATEGSQNSAPTVITLLTGVEAILSAAPNAGRAASILSPWNLGGSGMDAGAP